MSELAANTQSAVPRSATTGELVTTTARRNRLGIWMCIVSDAAGTVALLVAYVYLWSLNVNNAWAPPKDTWADPIPFWLITTGVVVAALSMWWAVAGIGAGRTSQFIAGSVVASLVTLVTLIGQIWQLSTFPFDITDGAYASATFWLCIATALHLSVVGFLTSAMIGRLRAGRITREDHSHARLVAMWMTWVCVAVFLGAFFATTMNVSPNSNSPTFGTFQE
ncbi:MAG: cytochrome c oxidase subunit 3 [Actinobacteria bacterium]|nr:cytochrome c oxidase subunit 3 [Actinomycetota bacterium]